MKALPPGTAWRGRWNLEVLYLGDIDVGRVVDRGGRGDKPRAIFTLDHHRAFWKTFPTVMAAKADVETRLADWLQRAGLAE